MYQRIDITDGSTSAPIEGVRWWRVVAVGNGTPKVAVNDAAPHTLTAFETGFYSHPVRLQLVGPISVEYSQSERDPFPGSVASLPSSGGGGTTIPNPLPVVQQVPSTEILYSGVPTVDTAFLDTKTSTPALNQDGYFDVDVTFHDNNAGGEPANRFVEVIHYDSDGATVLGRWRRRITDTMADLQLRGIFIKATTNGKLKVTTSGGSGANVGTLTVMLCIRKME